MTIILALACLAVAATALFMAGGFKRKIAEQNSERAEDRKLLESLADTVESLTEVKTGLATQDGTLSALRTELTEQAGALSKTDKALDRLIDQLNDRMKNIGTELRSSKQLSSHLESRLERLAETVTEQGEQLRKLDEQTPRALSELRKIATPAERQLDQLRKAQSDVSAIEKKLAGLELLVDEIHLTVRSVIRGGVPDEPKERSGP